jgi:hypothetical protein
MLTADIKACTSAKMPITVLLKAISGLIALLELPLLSTEIQNTGKSIILNFYCSIKRAPIT